MVSREGLVLRSGRQSTNQSRVQSTYSVGTATWTIAQPGSAPVGTGSDVRQRLLRRGDALAVGLLLVLIGVVAWVKLWYRPGLGDWDVMTFYLPWYGFL